MLRFLLFTVFFLTTSITVTAQTIVPFERDQFGRILLPVITSGGADELLQFDTGAGRSGISSAKRDIFQLKGRRGAIRHLASSGYERLPIGIISDMEVAGIPVTDHKVAIYPSDYKIIEADRERVPGVVGFDVFRGRLIQIDPTERQIIHSANSGFLDHDEWDIVAGYANDNANIMATVEYKGVELHVLFATGFSKSSINHSAFNRLFPEQKDRVQTRRINVTKGMENRVRALGVVTLQNLNISGWDIGDLEVAVANVTSRHITGEKGLPLLVLGAEILTHTALVFDFRDFRIWHRRSDSTLVSSN